MEEFNDNFPPYETMAHHSAEEGKVIRRKLWNVFWIMLIITIVELIIGFKAHDLGMSKMMLKIIFISLTIAKAGFIVISFMHLGHEKKALKYIILVPYITFICYLLFICLTEGDYTRDMRVFFVNMIQ